MCASRSTPLEHLAIQHTSIDVAKKKNNKENKTKKNRKKPCPLERKKWGKKAVLPPSSGIHYSYTALRDKNRKSKKKTKKQSLWYMCLPLPPPEKPFSLLLPSDLRKIICPTLVDLDRCSSSCPCCSEGREAWAPKGRCRPRTESPRAVALLFVVRNSGPWGQPSIVRCRDPCCRSCPLGGLACRCQISWSNHPPYA